MAKKEYSSPMAKVKWHGREDVITASGEGTTTEGFSVKYGSFDSSWITEAE